MTETRLVFDVAKKVVTELVNFVEIRTGKKQTELRKAGISFVRMATELYEQNNDLDNDPNFNCDLD